MALHSELPIYKVAYDLSDLAIDLVRNMPRDVKGVIGDELRRECLSLVVLIYRANVARDKVPHLSELLERAQVAELLLRHSRDKRFISTGQYAKAIALTGAVSRQAIGWRKHSASDRASRRRLSPTAARASGAAARSTPSSAWNRRSAPSPRTGRGRRTT